MGPPLHPPTVGPNCKKQLVATLLGEYGRQPQEPRDLRLRHRAGEGGARYLRLRVNPRRLKPAQGVPIIEVWE